MFVPRPFDAYVSMRERILRSSRFIARQLDAAPRRPAIDKLLEHLAAVLEAGEEDHRGDDEGLVAGFAIGREAVALEDAGGDFAGLAAHVGDIGGEAMHVEG